MDTFNEWPEDEVKRQRMERTRRQRILAEEVYVEQDEDDNYGNQQRVDASPPFQQTYNLMYNDDLDEPMSAPVYTNGGQDSLEVTGTSMLEAVAKGKALPRCQSLPSGSVLAARGMKRSTSVNTHVFDSYRVCRKCGSQDIERQVDHTSRETFACYCMKCQDLFAVDDSMTADEVLETLRSGHLVTLFGCCDNHDPNLFDLVLNKDKSEVVVRCRPCNTESPLGDELVLGADGVAEGSSDGGQEGSKEAEFYAGEYGDQQLRCGCCSNEDVKAMRVHRNTFDQMDMIACLSCGKQFTSVADMVKGKHLPGEAVGLDEHDVEFTVDDRTPEEFLPELLECKCEPGASDKGCERDDQGKITMIFCRNCQLVHLPGDVKHSTGGKGKTSELHGKQVPDTRSGKSGGSPSKNCAPRYCEVRSIYYLERGDHIAWDRPEGYMHHAIVTDVFTDLNTVAVIHYNGPSPQSQTNWTKGLICRETFDPFKQPGLFFRIVYDDCYPADRVIARAATKLGEIKYSLMSNNCEHFATWCKTGEKRSIQVDSVWNDLVRLSSKMTSKASGSMISNLLRGTSAAEAKNLLKVAQVAGSMGIVPTSAVDAVDDVARMGTAAAVDLADDAALAVGKGAGALRRATSSAVSVGTVVLVAGIEIHRTVADVKQLLKRRQDGDLTGTGYVRLVVKRVGQGMGTVGGSLLGSTVGAFVLPIPGVGSFVGGTLGGFIGKYAGAMVGGLAGGYVADKKQQNSEKKQESSVMSDENRI